MQYKLYVDETIPEDDIALFWDSLQQIVDENENINYETHNEPFIAEGNAVMLINSEWGYKRPMASDVEELSALYPDVKFHLIQASNILNGDHFETLKNYTLTEFENGRQKRILKPQPIEWVVSREFKTLDPWA